MLSVMNRCSSLRLNVRGGNELRNLLDRRGCYKGGKVGHIARNCNDARCYKCGKVGHIASNCSDDAELRCSICFKNGHMARDCCGDGCCKCSRVGHLEGIWVRTVGKDGHYATECRTAGPKIQDV
ncbi:DNA-binding protein HEXBP [Tanacetum coccineum]